MKTLRMMGLLLALFVALGLWPMVALADGGHAVFGETYTLKAGETLPEDLAVLGGNATLEADSVVEGNVIFLGGEGVLAGRVNGDVASMGGALRIESTAVIEGDVTAFGAIEIHPDAQIEGELVKVMDASGRLRPAAPGIENQATPARPEIPAAPTAPRAPNAAVRSAARLGGSLAGLIVVLFAAALIVNFAPDHLARVTAMMTSAPALSAGIGLLTLVVTVILIPILVVICIGLPVAIVLGLAFALAALLGWVAAGRLAGQKLAPLFKIKLASPQNEALLGTLALSIVAMLPGLGALLGTVVVCWGVGAAVMTRFGVMSGAAPFGGPFPAQPTPPAPPQPPMPPAPPAAPRPKETKPLDASLLVDEE